MEFFLSKLNIFMLPPLLYLAAGLTLAVISVAKGKLERENILFSLVCVWWSLLAPAFLMHHLIESEDTILRIERGIHFVYVFIPFVNLVFFHHILGLKRRKIEIAAFILSAVIAASTQTEYYFNGLYKFNWGYIAKGNIFFQVFGAYAFVVIAYCTVITILRYRVETNQVVKLKVKYIFTSLLISAFLTSLNIPAINGIDFYPFGNFMFIPLGIMAYGVLRYRIMDIQSIIHITAIWAAISSLIVIPNVVVFVLAGPYVRDLDGRVIFVLLGTWFYLNYYYLRKIQPLINQLFNKRKYNLRKIENNFINDISLLKSLKALRDELADITRKTLNLKSAELFLREGETQRYEGGEGGVIELDPDIPDWFLGANHLAERNMVATNPYYVYVREKLMVLFEDRDCSFIVPLVQNNALLGLLFLGEKSNLKQLTPDEVSFINSVRSAGSIALSNSIMYQDISNMKDNLEVLVRERTRELQKKNEQMLFELKVAKNVQETILPTNLPFNDNIKIASRIIPLMEVSGDFYDVIRIGDDRIAVAMVDVSGHGVPSALLTSMIKTEIDSQLKHETDTAKVCTAVNQNLRATLSETGFYCTMVLCVIDLSKMEMEYSNCGHTSPIHFKHDGTIDMLTTEGFFIGTPLEAVYEGRKVTLSKGDRLYFYTDGVIEARGAGDLFFDDATFIAALKETRGLEVDKQLNEILNRIQEFQKGGSADHRDDITLMVVEIGSSMSIARRIKDAFRFYKSKDYRKSVEILHQIDERSLSDMQLYLLSRLHSGINEPEKALYYISKALENMPSNREYLYYKGKTLFRMGRMEDAAGVFGTLAHIDESYKKTRLFIVKIGEKLSDGG